MRAKEFIREFTINVPVTVNVPIPATAFSSEQKPSPPPSSTSGFSSSKPNVVNPGVRYSPDGTAKWSPPLQQHLDTVKDSVGPSEDDPIEINKEDVYHPPQLDLKKVLADPNADDSIATKSQKPSMLG